ncbi:hypothetical protein R1flu_008790 [Riccia fluitans]|uniref:Uncharacterized protein n=1 Tax=Riccia fluitans TaxID=41844 RepID=A0ABD1XEI9_9MARC
MHSRNCLKEPYKTMVLVVSRSITASSVNGENNVLVMNGFCPLGFPSRIWPSSPAGTGEQRAPSALVVDHFSVARGPDDRYRPTRSGIGYTFLQNISLDDCEASVMFIERYRETVDRLRSSVERLKAAIIITYTKHDISRSQIPHFPTVNIRCEVDLAVHNLC